MRSANMEPLRKMTQAQYFKIIEYKNNIPMYTNTEADDPDAIPMTLFDILPQNLHYPKLNFVKFYNILTP